MRITGIIRTRHHTPGYIAAAIAADNLQDMETEAVETEGIVRTTISGTRIRSVIVSVSLVPCSASMTTKSSPAPVSASMTFMLTRS